MPPNQPSSLGQTSREWSAKGFYSGPWLPCCRSKWYATAQTQAVPEPFCIKYYGSINAVVNVADAVPKFGLDQVLCPRRLYFSPVAGALLELCPRPRCEDSPFFNETDSVAIDLRFVLGGRLTGFKSLPIDALELGELLSTNGSVSWPFTNNGEPVVLMTDPVEFETFDPVCVVNGTEKSLVAALAEGKGPYYGCNLACGNLPEGTASCGHNLVGDWWAEQSFKWHMEEPLNYTFTLQNNKASAMLWTQSEYLRSSNGTGTGSFTTAYLDPTICRLCSPQHARFFVVQPEGYVGGRGRRVAVPRSFRPRKRQRQHYLDVPENREPASV